MNAIKIILHLIGWLITIIIQVIGSFLVIFLFSVIFAEAADGSRSGWLFLLFMIWLGYMVGINLIGQIALRWVWQSSKRLTWQRLVGSAIGALIPLLILIPIGFSVPAGEAGTQYYDLVTNNWQPLLAQVAAMGGIIGFYVPGLLKNREKSITGE